MAIDLGDVVPLAVTIRDAAGVATDASSVVLTIKLPDGSAATPTVTHPATGQYACDYLPTMAGLHAARWESTGPSSAYADVFDVRPADALYMVSLTDAKNQLKMTAEDSDEELRSKIEAVTGVVERELGQAVIRRAFVEEHNASGSVVLNRTPVASLTAMSRVDGTYTWDVASLHVSPAGVVTSPRGAVPSGRVTVTYVAGMAVIPREYTEAAMIILQQMWETRRPRGATVSGLEVSTGFSVPNRAKELLGGGLPVIA